MIDLLVVAACAVAAVLGWRKGAVLTALPVAGLLAGYAAAFLLHRPLGNLLVERFAIPGLLAYGLAGAGALLATVLAFRLLERRLRRSLTEASAHEREEDRDIGGLRRAPGPGSVARAGGAVLGTAWALGVAMVLVWGVESVAAMTGTAPGPSSVTGRMASAALGGVTRSVVVRRTGDPFAASAAAAMLSDPAGFAEMVRGLAGSEDLRRLASDPELAGHLSRGRAEALARRPELARLLDDARFMDGARRLGVVDGSTDSAEELAESLAAALGPLSSAVTALRGDPEAMDLVDRLDIANRLQSGDLMDLVGDADFNALASLVAEAMKGHSRRHQGFSQ